MPVEIIPVERLLVSFKEAAQIMGVSKSQFYRFARREGLEVVMVGGCSRVPLDELKGWIELNRLSINQKI